MEHYKAYLRYESTHGKNQIKAEKHLANCLFALEAIQNPVPFQPVNLGPNVNSNLNEYFPCITADNQTLVFTRLLTNVRSVTGRREEAYLSYFRNGDWEFAAELGCSYKYQF